MLWRLTALGSRRHRASNQFQRAATDFGEIERGPATATATSTTRHSEGGTAMDIAAESVQKYRAKTERARAMPVTLPGSLAAQQPAWILKHLDMSREPMLPPGLPAAVLWPPGPRRRLLARLSPTALRLAPGLTWLMGWQRSSQTSQQPASLHAIGEHSQNARVW